nr:uncharacterized protein LOC106624857 isoform X1 [Bactrocera oleae]XP_036212673.1 uncharacterized protein LOC106624857 isoform X1 [Bactrocera oleae]XP_036212674.1 uncharacterized protein LOC106624857 isoform X1 [Bactrocera oleae]XP_036212675.1 uncharacterized protein LOC106624857 isoform X1 [Bactrocera oleae]XP_036212676.1 uncharacterized protein LOC106624857 isoform X1 [Bactrocera oleae]
MQPARALLDLCSELNFITEETANRLQLKRVFSHQEISNISDIRSNSKYAVNAKIKSRIGDFTCISQFAITKQITTQIPSSFFNTSKWDIPANLQLADPYFYKPQRIDLLLNAEIFFESLQEGRFLALERRLSYNKLLKNMYADFIKEYIKLGHMVAIKNFDLNSSHYIIPHHCILSPQSTTTMLRVVFDASARTTSDRSLNEILMVGARIQPELIMTLLSFRLYPYVLTADVSKIYRQFLIDEQDQRYQLILWRNESYEPLQLFQLKTVTYGLASAPFLATDSLLYIADVNKDVFPLASSAIRENFYVDDLLTGAESIDNLQKLKIEIIEVLRSHGLSLTKWHSNSTQLSDASYKEVIIKTTEENITKALGTSWKPLAGTLCYRYELADMQPVTKRSVLSIISKIFDILGLLNLVIIRDDIAD